MFTSKNDAARSDLVPVDAARAPSDGIGCIQGLSDSIAAAKINPVQKLLVQATLGVQQRALVRTIANDWREAEEDRSRRALTVTKASQAQRMEEELGCINEQHIAFAAKVGASIAEQRRELGEDEAVRTIRHIRSLRSNSDLDSESQAMLEGFARSNLMNYVYSLNGQDAPRNNPQS